MILYVFLLIVLIYLLSKRDSFIQIGGSPGELGAPCSWGKPCGRYKKGKTNEQLLCQGTPEVCLLPENSQCDIDNDCGFKNGFKMSCRGFPKKCSL